MTKQTVVNAYFDGLCEPRNPGGYACGGWYVEPNDEVPGLEQGIRGAKFFQKGAGATNNVAEYNAALECLRALYRAGYRGVVVLHGDSQLVVNQVTGVWRCNKPELQELRDQVRHGMTFFERVDVLWVPRDENAVADELSREAYRQEAGKSI